MGKKYEVKDINKNNKIDSWEQAKYDAINSQGPASARFLKRLNNAGGIAGLLQSQPGSQGLLNPNQSMSKVQGMVRQQPTTPMGMDVSTNAQILNQAYDPRMAVNYMDKGMAKKGSIGPAEMEGSLNKKENTEDKKIKKLVKKEKENQESDKTSSRKTAANQQKIKNQIDKKKRLEKRAKRKEGRQERKEIRKKAREGKMTRGEKIDAIKSSRDKQKGKKKKETETKSKKVNNNNTEVEIGL